jgi:hypothetical protein
MMKEKMKSFREFRDESKGSLNIFDIDDTLFHTTAQITVKKDGKVVKKLTNAEYNTYRLKAGESFDYSEFKDAAKFYKESRPITRMINKAKEIVNRMNNPLSRTIIITARANFDNRDKFLATFRKYGFPIDKVYVERAGNMTDIDLPAEKKAVIISKYLKGGDFKKVRLFDDSMSNLRTFLRLKTQFPTVKFEAYFANPDGSVKTIR